jgi:hypothetical protein
VVRESLAPAMLTSKCIPPRVPTARWPEAIVTVPWAAALPAMRTVMLWILPLLVGRAPLSWTPGTNVRRFRRTAELLSLA